MNGKTLTISGLTKTYRNGVRALEDLSLEISPGMFGLLGPNGAGKSTLMRILATLQSPDQGQINFGPTDLFKNPQEIRKILGYLPQSFGVYPKTSAQDLLDYFAILKGISSRKDRGMVVDRVLEITNLHDVRKKNVDGYSGGMKQRFGIAQLLLNDPQLIIVDEPTAGLDPAERNRFLNVLRAIASDNTILFSTHIVEDVKDLCNDMAIINKGQILKNTSPLEAIASLEGKIWSTSCPESDLPSYEEKYNVISTGFNLDNSTKLRVFSEQELGESFHIEEANLEDAYFAVLKGLLV